MRRIPVILGATASGKSDLALALAQRHGAEIISVDSMKIYRGMDIGTCKPTPELRQAVTHHGIDIRNPDKSYNAYEFYADCQQLLMDRRAAGKTVILEGGTALYYHVLFSGIFQGPESDWELRAQLEAEAAQSGEPEYLHRRLQGLDPTAALRLHPNDTRRVLRALEVCLLTGKPMSQLQSELTKPAPYEFEIVGLRWPRDFLYERINRRVRMMFDAGLVDEVAALTKRLTLSRQASQALGYKEVQAFLRGEASELEALQCIQQNTRRFAKHQETWFRRFKTIHWLDAAGVDADVLAQEAEEYLGHWLTA